MPQGSFVCAWRGAVEFQVSQEFARYGSLDLAIEAVFASWLVSAPATTARTRRWTIVFGTAVNVMTMVLGSVGEDSGTGVAFSRNPSTSEDRLPEPTPGEDVVASARHGPGTAAPKFRMRQLTNHRCDMRT